MMKPFLEEVNKKGAIKRHSQKSKPLPEHAVLAVLEQPKSSDQNEVVTFIASRDRFNLWIKAIKARYWIHLGNVEEFQVNWHDVKDSANEMVEHIVKVDQCKESNEISRLYTLSLYYTKCKIMIQGLFRDHWVKRKFPLLQEMVNLLEKGIPPNKAYESCSGSVVNISDADLLLSDDAAETVEVTDQTLSKSKQSSPLPPKCNKTPPVKRSTKVKRRSFSSQPKSTKQATEKVNGDDEIGLYDTLADRISHLENSLAKFENSEADKIMLELQSNDNEINLIDKATSELLGKFEDSKKAWKHELSIVKQQSAQERSDNQELILKLQADNKKLSNKLCSIQDQHLDLCKRMKDLEEGTKMVQENLSSFDCKLESLELSIDAILLAKAADPQVIEPTPRETEVMTQPSTDIITKHDEQIIDNPNTEDSSSQCSEINASSVPPSSQKTNSKFHADIIVLMDSNRRFIDAKRLYPGQKVSILKCGNLETAKSILSTPRFVNPKVIVLHVGVNDVESSPVAEICNNFIETVQIAMQSFPSAKLIISEITPRSDNFNLQVKEVNSFLNSQFLFNLPSSFLVIQHPDLHTKECLFDRKHLSRNTGVKRLASDLSNALHEILRISRPPQPHNTKFQSYHQDKSRPFVTPSRHAPLPRESLQVKEKLEFEHLTKELITHLRTMTSAMSNFNRPSPSAMVPPPPPQFYQFPQQSPSLIKGGPMNGPILPMKQPAWALAPKTHQPTGFMYPSNISQIN